MIGFTQAPRRARFGDQGRWRAAVACAALAGIAGMAIVNGACADGSTTSRFSTRPLRRNLQPEALIEGRLIRVEPQLSRNFQPSDRRERPLGANVRVRSVDGIALPPGLKASRIFAFQDPWSWETTLSLADMGDFGPSISNYRSDTPGPEWDPARTVDIVIELVDGAGQSHFPGVRDRTINTPR